MYTFACKESLMCYDEIAIAALLSMGGPTQFLNSGNRCKREMVTLRFAFKAKVER